MDVQIQWKEANETNAQEEFPVFFILKNVRVRKENEVYVQYGRSKPEQDGFMGMEKRAFPFVFGKYFVVIAYIAVVDIRIGKRMMVDIVLFCPPRSRQPDEKVCGYVRKESIGFGARKILAMDEVMGNEAELYDQDVKQDDGRHDRHLFHENQSCDIERKTNQQVYASVERRRGKQIFFGHFVAKFCEVGGIQLFIFHLQDKNE